MPENTSRTPLFPEETLLEHGPGNVPAGELHAKLSEVLARPKYSSTLEDIRAAFESMRSVPVSNNVQSESEFGFLKRDLAFVEVPEVEVDFGAETRRLVEECADRYTEVPTHSEESSYVQNCGEPLDILYQQCLAAVKRQTRIFSR